jgi:DNA-binding beta-propeller fold protein YncE
MNNPSNKSLLTLKSSIAALIFLLSVYNTANCSAQDKPGRYLLALSKNDHTLAIVDASGLKVIARVPVGPDPHEVIASADGKTAYVSNYAGGSLHELDIIDLVAKKALPSFDTKALIGLHGLAFADGKLWFTAEGSKAVGRYDPQTGQVDWIMGTGQDRTHMIYVTPDGKRVYTTNVRSGTVSILADTLLPPQRMPPGFMPPNGGRLPNGNMPPKGFGPPDARPHRAWQQTLISVSKGSEGFDVSPDGKELWTAAASDGSIAVIDLSGLKLSETIDAKAIGANRLKFTPDGKRVLVTSLNTGDLFIYDAVSHQQLKRLNTGHGAAGILVDPDGSRAFIGCTADNYVAVVDLNTLTITGHIDVGGGPDGLAWAIIP